MTPTCVSAKILGAKVIGTVSSEAKFKEVLNAGADHVLLSNLPEEEFCEKVKKWSGGGVHVSYESVGKINVLYTLPSC